MPGIETPGGVPANKRDVLYDLFVQAGTFQGIFKTFFELCEELNLKPFAEHRNFYPKFKSQLTSWKAASLWSKLDKRYNRKEYKKGKACNNTRVFIIGAGPCGLRTAIECAMLGTKVVVVEKRFSFSRNNVLHLWPFLITDLRSLGAKKFFGKFCAGAIDHISIRQLQVVLLKVALIMGVEIHYGVGYEGLEVPPEDQEHEKIGWRAKLDPKDHPVSEYEFDVIVGADGKRNTLHGFKRKEFRGKLAIAITANFINRKSNEEASVEEISGVAFIFNQKFFMDLRESTGIDLENIVYYKDETHYFVMTAKKQSLLAKGVILKDLPDTAKLLRQDNYNHQKLQEYAREAADFCTNFQLPTLDYALNHHGKPDVAMFDFTSIYAADNAARVLDRNGHKLLLALVGDSLLEPFWPTGSGCARGFLSSLDAAWMIRSWSSGDMTPLEVLAERESSYRLLAQTTPENLCKIYESYGINPNSRYPHLNTKAVTPHEIRHQYDTLDEDLKAQFEILEKKPSIVLSRTASVVRSSKVQMWCQRVTDNYLNVMVENMTSSWRNGLAFCAIIHRYRPDLIDYDSLRPENVVQNNQLAFDIAEREFGITPAMTGKEMAAIACPDKLTIVAYVVRFYDLFKDELPASVKQENNTKENNIAQALPAPTKSSSKTSFLSRIASKVRRKSHEKHDKENGEKAKASGSGLGSKRKHHKHKDSAADDIAEKRKLMAQEARKANQSENNSLNVADKNELNVGVRGQNKVSGLAEQLQANLRSNYGMNTVTDGPRPKMRPLIETGNVQASQLCVFCSKRVYVMERLSAEGMFFHRDCFKCQDCDVTIRIGNYAYLPDPDGEKGRFLCREHFAARKQAVRKRSLSDKEKEAVQSKKPVFSFDSIEEVEDENENISRPNPTTPKTPKTPKGPFRKRNLLSPFFGKRSKTTPERDEMQKMYEQMAESKGALTEEEQARYNLGTSVNTDDELDESSDSELDEEEKAWLAREGLSSKRGSSKRKKGSGKKKEGTPSNLQVPLASDHNIPESDLSPTSDVPPCTFDGGIPRSESSSKEKKSRLSRMRPHRRDATKANKTGRRTSAGMQQGEESIKDKNFRQRSASTKVDSSKPPDGAIPKQRKSRSLKLKKRSSAGKLGLSSTEGDSDREERPLSPSSLDLPLGQFGEEGARSKRKVPDVVADLGLGSPEAAATEQLPRLIKKLSVDANLTGDFDIDSTTDEEEMKRDEASSDAEPTEQITDSPRSKGKSPRRMWGKRFKRLRSLKKLRQEKRKMEEEELSARLTKRVQKEARRQHHQQQLKRHRLAQEIQRQLQEVEVKQRELENRGVAAERALRGEETPEGVDETTLMQEWFSLVNEKNALVRFETELMVQARELELEDRHSQLEQELRLIMAVGEGKKSSTDRDQEKLLLDEMLEVVEQRDALVAFLEEERVKYDETALGLQEQQEDQDFEAIMLKKGLMTAVR
ncbi:F-actin-monooxygenase MICAL2 isoform X3 [Strongylocentrotus purpuratus]|uniref:F-actin monooxygenase n=1 Tax=Strongylocentrotus purpuratus TaxID=7668 RepID=A0A7M7P018_STRPU|nr:F-actin-monooxygenase MICAL2 isoform X3 [Strongylocentrotus purpuratus]